MKQDRGFWIDKAASCDHVHYCSTCNSPTTCLERKQCAQYKGRDYTAKVNGPPLTKEIK